MAALMLKRFRVQRFAPLASGIPYYRHFIASTSVGNPAEADATARTPEAVAAETAAKKTGRAAYWFVGVAAAAVLGTLAYPTLVDLPPPQKPPTASPVPPPVAPPPAVDPPPPKPSLSPREELEQRLVSLRSELAELRKQKKSQLVNLKKRGIKDEISMIESGLKKLEKA